jgi:hypothetical protein
MLTVFLAKQRQNDITLLTKKLIMIGEKVTITPEGRNHGHTDTITPQSSKTPLHLAETMAENLQEKPEHPKTKGGNHHHTATNQNTVKHSGTKGGKLQPRAKSQEPRAKSKEQRAKSQEPRAKSREP